MNDLRVGDKVSVTFEQNNTAYHICGNVIRIAKDRIYISTNDYASFNDCWVIKESEIKNIKKETEIYEQESINDNSEDIAE